jgi:hypothetical protein
VNNACIIIDYFGKLTEHFKFFLKSCEYNPTFNWLIHTDDKYEGDVPPNVRIEHISWEDYIEHVRTTLYINFRPAVPYKICDLKPALGYLWSNQICEYQYWGFGDLDVAYGDLSTYFDEAVIDENLSLVSVHSWSASGPLCFIRNTKELRSLFKMVDGWQKHFETPDCVRFDEDIFLRGIHPNDPKLSDLKCKLEDKCITPLTKGLWSDQTEYVHDDMFFWYEGSISSLYNPTKEFIMIHFMNYEKARWMDPIYGEVAPWTLLKDRIHPQFPKTFKGFTISLYGINPYPFIVDYI